MKKFVVLLFIIINLFCLTGCSDEHPNLIFNKDPITKDTVMYSTNVFEEGQKIYYLYYTPKKIKAKYIRVQVFKVEEKINRGGYKIYMTNDYRVMQNNMYYYTNNLTIHLKGRYVMQIFDVEDLSKPLVYNQFFVR